MGWYVWIFIVIMRWQNHFPETEFGDSETPQDLYSPFFLASFLQGKVLLGYATGLLPWPRAIITLCGTVSLLLLTQVCLFRPCRFIMVNWVFATGFVVCIIISIVALMLTFSS